MSDPDSVNAARVIPFLSFGGGGQKILFLHANGYPPACYRPLLEALAREFQPIAVPLRPLWPGEVPGRVHSWKIFSEDLLRFTAEKNLSPALVVGHSLGAVVALRAALQAPDQIAALVLLDPVLFPPHAMLLWTVVRALGIAYRVHPMIRGALRRRPVFASREQALEGYRQRYVFRHMSEENLRVCIDGLLSTGADGALRLVYSPHWEARVYYTAIWSDWDLWRNISDLEVPTLIVRGEESDAFSKSTADAVLSRNPRFQMVNLERASHLVPLERPDDVAGLTIRFLRQVARRDRSAQGAGAIRAASPKENNA